MFCSDVISFDSLSIYVSRVIGHQTQEELSENHLVSSIAEEILLKSPQRTSHMICLQQEMAHQTD